MKSIELFAGAGGLALAMANAGFHHHAVYEWNRNACATLRRNQSNGLSQLTGAEIVEGDVSNVCFSELAGNVDVVSGGPPCQPFSIGGKHVGMDDRRNMFPHAIRTVREIAPRAFIFENVKGLLRESFSNYYQYIIHQLSFPEIVAKGDEEWTDHLVRLERASKSRRKTGLTYSEIRGRVERLRCLFPGMLLEPWRTVRDAISDLPEIAPGELCTKFANHFLNPGARSCW